MRKLLALILARLREGHGIKVLKGNSGLLYSASRRPTQRCLIAAESVNVLDDANLQLLNSN